MIYNMTNLTSSTNIANTAIEINKLTDYSILGIFIIISLTVIIFIGLKASASGARTIIPATFFLLTIAGIYLAVMKLIPEYVMYILIVITSISLFSSVFINPEG